MAQFDVTTAMVSIVLSVFMAGLGLGSWVAGKWLNNSGRAHNFSALRLYAGTEFLIGMSGLLVPYELGLSHQVLTHLALATSLQYYLFSGLCVAIALLPWCALMGATVPIGMLAIRQTLTSESSRSFSYLYMANVGGAIFGTTLPLLFIELYGFRGTLKIGVLCNILISLSALILSTPLLQTAPASFEEPFQPVGGTIGGTNGDFKILGLLFLSGLSCMGMEVVWVRAYTPYLGTVVYAFAAILAVYLYTTYVGSFFYRRWSVRWTKESPLIWTLLAFASLLPLLSANPDIPLNGLLRLFVGIGLFTGLIGFLTPMLVDRFSKGDPSRAGCAYATNVVGCLLGPLLAGFGLLPFLSERGALVLLTLPWLIVGLAPLRSSNLGRRVRIAAYALMAGVVALIISGKGYEGSLRNARILRDQTATVIAYGSGMKKNLLINGYGITNLTPITKVMAHLPLSFLGHRPENALVICFGMGTTLRAVHSWGIPVIAVELVPSVPRLFSYYHEDGDAILRSAQTQVVIDDGRRYLERTTVQFDVITIDPPPPLGAATSSLLYSEEFYRVAQTRLREGGILQQWLPATMDGEPVEVAAVTRALRESFAYVRAFRDELGIHYLASDHELPKRSAEELLARMPTAAIADLAEWDSSANITANNAAEHRLTDLLESEIPVNQLIARSPLTPAITDDRPIIEYYAYRRLRGSLFPSNL